MALTSIANKTHWFGVFLLLIATISAPVINDISLLRVTLPTEIGLKHTTLSFGTFGYCILDVTPDGPDFCSTRHIGYNPAAIASRIDHAAISSIEGGTTASLTRVLVLHPIETGLAFIAFLLALGHGMIGSLAGATVAFVAWILVLISLAIDFSLFGIVRHHVNNDGSGSRASFGTGLWCLTAAFVTLGLGMVLVVFTCCAHAREKRNVRKTEREGGMGSSTAAGPRRRKRFGIF